MKSHRIFQESRSLSKVLLISVTIFVGSVLSSEDFARQTGRFAADLYKTVVAAEKENVVISPVSIHKALSLLYCGADGTTAREMSDVMYLEDGKVGIAENYKSLIERHMGSDIISLANKIYLNESIHVRLQFAQLASDNFYSGAENIDTSNGDRAAEIINNWIENKTDNRIVDLVSKVEVQDALSVIVNAIYFKAKWAIPFKPFRTNIRDFWISKNETIKVNMMSRVSSLPYGEFNGFRAIRLDYKNSEFSLLVLLPNEKEGLSQLETSLDQINVSQIVSELENVDINLRIPKFRTKFKTSLRQTLQKMGLHKMFTDFANFSGLTLDNVQISDVIHKSIFAINEEGTEAAAATTVISVHPVSGKYYYKPPQTFFVDRPFLYLLIDSFGHIFFIGRYTK